MSDREWSRSPSPLKMTSMQQIMAEEQQREQLAPTPGRQLSRAEKLEQKRKTAKGDALQLPGFSMSAFGGLASASNGASPFSNFQPSPQLAPPEPPSSSSSHPPSAPQEQDKQRKRPKPKPVSAATKAPAAAAAAAAEPNQKEKQSAIPVKTSVQKNKTISTTTPAAGASPKRRGKRKAPSTATSRDASNSPSSSDGEEAPASKRSGTQRAPRASSTLIVRSPLKSNANGVQDSSSSDNQKQSKSASAAASTSKVTSEQLRDASNSTKDQGRASVKAPSSTRKKGPTQEKTSELKDGAQTDEGDASVDEAQPATSQARSDETRKSNAGASQAQQLSQNRGKKRASAASQQGPAATSNPKRRKTLEAEDADGHPVDDSEPESHTSKNTGKTTTVNTSGDKGQGRRKVGQAKERETSAEQVEEGGHDPEPRQPAKKRKSVAQDLEQQRKSQSRAKSVGASETGPQRPAQGSQSKSKKRAAATRPRTDKKGQGKGSVSQSEQTASAKSKGQRRQTVEEGADDDDVPPGFTDEEESPGGAPSSSRLTRLWKALERPLAGMSRQPIESETAEDEKRIRSALKQFETKVGKETKTLKPSAAQTRQSLDPTKRKSASEVRRREKHLKAIRDEQAEEEALFEASRAKKRITRRLHNYAMRLSASAQFFDIKHKDLSRFGLFESPDADDLEATMRIVASLAAPQAPLLPHSGRSRASFDMDTSLKGTTFNERLDMWNVKFQEKLDQIEAGEEGEEDS